MELELRDSDVYAGMDPRLQAAVARHRGGERTVATAASSGDEISVIALVTDLDAWLAHSEVRPGVTIGDAEGGTLVTARLPIRRIDDIRRSGEVKSMKAAQQLSRMLSATIAEIGAPPAGLRSGGGKGAIVGIVDSGADFAHDNFRRRDGSTRIVTLWDQSGATTAASPPAGYGKRYEAADIDAALGAADPYAALGYGPAPDTIDEQGTHGTHVMDIAAGNGLGSGVAGVAPEADIMFVDPALSDVVWQGPGAVESAFGDSVQLLEALQFIFAEAGDRPCAVNISLGTNGGSHDGTSLVEQGIDTLVRQRPNRAVVIAASNSHDDHIHAAGAVAAGGAADLQWMLAVRPGECELEVWYSGQDEFEAELIAPGGQSVGRVPLGSTAQAPGPDNQPVLIVSHRAHDPNNGDNVIGLWLAPDVPGPDWTLRLHGVRVDAGGEFHAWIERNDSAQASFVVPHDDSHTVGSIACGHASLVVGSYDAHKATTPISWFSSEGPTRDGREKPEVSAPGHEVLAAHSRTRTGVTRKSGTSMAAPAVTGLTAVLVAEAAARGEDLDADRIRAIVMDTARSDPPPPGGWDPRYGYGRVSLPGVLGELA